MAINIPKSPSAIIADWRLVQDQEEHSPTNPMIIMVRIVVNPTFSTSAWKSIDMFVIAAKTLAVSG